MSETDLLPYYKEILNSIPENIDFNFIPVKVVSSKQIAEQFEVGSEDYNTAVASLSNVNIDIA